MESNSIHKGRFVIQEIQEQSFERNNKLINRHESLNNVRKFYITTNNSSLSTIEFPEMNVYIYEMNRKKWIKGEDVFKMKLNENDNLFYKVFKYMSNSSSDECGELHSQSISNLQNVKYVDDCNCVITKRNCLRLNSHYNVNMFKKDKGSSQYMEELNIKKILNNYCLGMNKNDKKYKGRYKNQLQIQKFSFIKEGCNKHKIFDFLDIERTLTFSIQ